MTDPILEEFNRRRDEAQAAYERREPERQAEARAQQRAREEQMKKIRAEVPRAFARLKKLGYPNGNRVQLRPHNGPQQDVISWELGITELKYDRNYRENAFYKMYVFSDQTFGKTGSPYANYSDAYRVDLDTFTNVELNTILEGLQRLGQK